MKTLSMRSIAKPASANEADRSIEAVIATPKAPVRRTGPKPDRTGWGTWVEELDLAGADLSRLVGAPLLLDHQPTADAQIGVVEAAGRTVDGLVATLRFSREQAGFSAWRDVVDGIRRQLSIGYQVIEWSGPTGNRDEPTFVALRWLPLEVSLTPIGADAGARFRSLATETGVLPPMNTTTTAEVRPDTTAAAVAAAGNARERAIGHTVVGVDAVELKPLHDEIVDGDVANFVQGDADDLRRVGQVV